MPPIAGVAGGVRPERRIGDDRVPSIVRDAAWRPSLGPNNTTFRMSDLLLFAFRGRKNLLAPVG
jgi:hypothetical protein